MAFLSQLSFAKSSGLTIFESPSSAFSETDKIARYSALILDQLAFGKDGSNSSEQPIQKTLLEHPDLNFGEAVAQLSPQQKQSLTSRVPQADLNELISISEETNSNIFKENLFHWGRSQESREHYEAAALVYTLLAGKDSAGRSVTLMDHVSESLQGRAAERLDVLSGNGPTGLHLEFTTRRLYSQILDPKTAFGMALGSTVFAGAYSALLPRFLSLSGSSILTRAIAAPALASTIAFSLEVPTFWATIKGLNELVAPGSQPWDYQNNLQELRGLAFSLGAFKLVAAGTGSLMGKLGGIQPNLGRIVLREAAKYSTQLATIIATQKFEESWGWRKPSNASNRLVDGLTALFHFTAGGKISETLFPSLYRFQRTLGLRNSLLEGSDSFSIMRRLVDGWNNFGAWGSALAGARTGAYAGYNPISEVQSTLGKKGLDASSFYTVGDFPAGSRTPIRGTYTLTKLRENAVTDFQTRKSFEAGLSQREGGDKDSFEQEISPVEFLTRISDGPRLEILEEMGMTEAKMDSVSEEKFGGSLASALQTRMQQILDPQTESYRDIPLPLLPESFRQALHSADEMIDIIEYLPRSNQKRILRNFTAAMDESMSLLPQLQETLVRYLGPHFQIPAEEMAKGEEIKHPHEAALAIGSGDMMAMLALLRHRIAPGEGLGEDRFSWRSRLLVSARQQVAADEINQKGTYEGNSSLKGVKINYQQDPKIEVVGPNGLGSLTQDLLRRTVRLQLINVPTDQLARVLTPEYIKGLPENAILCEVIGGFIGPQHRGAYQPAANGPKTLLPHQLIRLALHAHGRTDVKVISGGGFIPGAMLWQGQPVEMLFAGPESPILRSQSPEADFVAKVFAGEGKDNGFINARVTHHQHSTELGKALKNAANLMAGLKAARMARLILHGPEILSRYDATQAIEPEKWWLPHLHSLNGNDALVAGLRELVQTTHHQGNYETIIRQPIFQMMVGLLRINEQGMNPQKAGYQSEVRDDYGNGANINMEELIRVMKLAQAVDVQDKVELIILVTEEIIFNKKIAPTRNTRRGFAEGVIEMLREKGCPYRTEELMPPMTLEGVRGLPPLMDLYNYPTHPIERRRMDEEWYQLYDTFFPDQPAAVPLKIPSGVQDALNENIPEIDANTLRANLEGRSQKAINRLEIEIRRLKERQEKSLKDPTNLEHAQRLERQQALLPRLVDAMGDSNPLFILESPIYLPPYKNLVVIPMADSGTKPDYYRAFLHLDGETIMSRMTELGLFLKMFPRESRLHVEIETTGLNSEQRNQTEEMAEQLLATNLQSREGDITLEVNGRKIRVYATDRPEADRDQYYRDLDPLVTWLQESSPSEEINAATIRKARIEHTRLLDSLVKDGAEGAMLLGYYGGPINQMLKAALTRPEKQTMIGVYAEGRLVDVFTVYRNVRHLRAKAPVVQPMVLSHHVMRELAEDNDHYKNHSPVDMFHGFDLKRFRSDYEGYAQKMGYKDVQVRIWPVQSLPIEMALQGKIKGVNPISLRFFLMENSPERNAMLNEIYPLYERPYEEVLPKVQQILMKHVSHYEVERQSFLSGIRLYRMFKAHGASALKRLVYRTMRPDFPEKP